MTKLNWDCDKQGCFNIKKRLKFGVFDECFPGNLQFSDVDAITEIGGKFLLIEWKDGDCRDVDGGQRYMFQNMTRDDKYTVVCVYGDAEHMTVESMQVYSKGIVGDRVPSDIEELKSRVYEWVKRAKRT